MPNSTDTVPRYRPRHAAYAPALGDPSAIAREMHDSMVASVAVRLLAAVDTPQSRLLYRELHRSAALFPTAQPSIRSTDVVTRETTGFGTWFTCRCCGHQMGMSGPGSGSDEDLAVEDYFESEVEYHTSGQCIQAAAS